MGGEEQGRVTITLYLEIEENTVKEAEQQPWEMANLVPPSTTYGPWRCMCEQTSVRYGHGEGRTEGETTQLPIKTKYTEGEIISWDCKSEI